MTDDAQIVDVFEIKKHALPHEISTVVVPTARLRATELVVLLKQNGVQCRTIGKGSGRICTREGVSAANFVVLAVHANDLHRAHRYLRLFGAYQVELDRLAKSALR